MWQKKSNSRYYVFKEQTNIPRTTEKQTKKKDFLLSRSIAYENKDTHVAFYIGKQRKDTNKEVSERGAGVITFLPTEFETYTSNYYAIEGRLLSIDIHLPMKENEEHMSFRIINVYMPASKTPIEKITTEILKKKIVEYNPHVLIHQWWL